MSCSILSLICTACIFIRICFKKLILVPYVMSTVCSIFDVLAGFCVVSIVPISLGNAQLY